MASIGSDKNGLKRILFVAQDGRRKTIRLGKVSKKQAIAFKTKLEALIAATFTGSMDDETGRWLADLDDKMHAKLAVVGLVASRQSMHLAAFLDEYIQSRRDVKSSTATVYGHTRRCLVEYFGESKPLRAITPADADQWRIWLLSQGLADNTARRRCGIAKQFFRAALRSKLVSENPFADLVSAVKANTSRMVFISRKMSDRVMDACPSAQWRLIFALCRYGGLRCPSEVLALTWADIDWSRDRILVRSCKTAHQGKATRWIPLFPEIRPHLHAVFEQAEVGTERVITEYAAGTKNLRTHFRQIVCRAGLDVWPKLFQNLRSTRETELCETWPEHVVTAWIGNSSAVARKHYLQVTEDHFVRAARGTESGTVTGASARMERTERKSDKIVEEETTDSQRGCDILRNDASPCADSNLDDMGRTGLEPVTLRV